MYGFYVYMVQRKADLVRCHRPSAWNEEHPHLLSDDDEMGYFTMPQALCMMQ